MGVKMQTRVTNEWILERYDEIYPVYRFAFGRFLVQLRRDFDGDLDAMLVLLMLSLDTERQDWREALLGNYTSPTYTRLTNTQSIAHATGIPRESVRRKLEAMRAKGWVIRDAARNWAPTQIAAEELRESTLATVAFLKSVVSVAVSATPPDENGQATEPTV